MGTLGRRRGGLAAGNKVLLPDAPGHLRKGEGINSPFHVSAFVSVGKAAHKQLIERRAGNHSELAEFGHRIGKTPVRDAHAHAALDDFGNCTISKFFHK